jgi:hypothetical protein
MMIHEYGRQKRGDRKRIFLTGLTGLSGFVIFLFFLTLIIDRP